MTDFPDFARAGNQGGDPDTYEIENAAIDPDGTLDAALREVAQPRLRNPQVVPLVTDPAGVADGPIH